MHSVMETEVYSDLISDCFNRSVNAVSHGDYAHCIGAVHEHSEVIYSSR
jgi:hypothetical protein